MKYETSDWSSALLRLGVGTVFLVHGVGKLFGVGPAANPIPAFAGTLGELGVPAAIVFAYVVRVVETLGGLLVLLGLLTRYASAFIAMDMLAAVLLVHLPNGFVVANGGYEFALVLFLTSISLMLGGSGELSLEHELLGEEFHPSVDPKTLANRVT